MELRRAHKCAAGLGDVAVPGLLACLALRYDASRAVNMRSRAEAASAAISEVLADLDVSLFGPLRRSPPHLCRDGNFCLRSRNVKPCLTPLLPACSQPCLAGRWRMPVPRLQMQLMTEWPMPKRQGMASRLVPVCSRHRASSLMLFCTREPTSSLPW